MGGPARKAFAKFVGSYSALDGGYPFWVLQALTGDEVSLWRLDNSQCRAAFEIRYKKKDSARCCFGRTQPREVDVQCYKTMEIGTHKRLTDDKFAYTV
jgi:hypothetical protein